MKRLSIFGGRKRESLTVRGVVTGSTGGIAGFVKNRDHTIQMIPQENSA